MQMYISLSYKNLQIVYLTAKKEFSLSRFGSDVNKFYVENFEELLKSRVSNS